MTQQPFYQKYQRKIGKFWENSNSKLIHERGLYFGNNPELTEKEIEEMDLRLDKIIDSFNLQKSKEKENIPN